MKTTKFILEITSDKEITDDEMAELHGEIMDSEVGHDWLVTLYRDK